MGRNILQRSTAMPVMGLQGALLQDSGLLLSKGVARSLETYPDKSRLDRRIVLIAVMDRHLHDVEASEPSATADARPEHVLATTATLAQQRTGAAATETSNGGAIHTTSPRLEASTPASQLQTTATSRHPHEGRTWVTQWTAGKHSQAPLNGLRQGSDVPRKRDPQSSREDSSGNSSEWLQSANGVAANASSSSQATSEATSSWDFAAADSRSTICMHPGSQRRAATAGHDASHAAAAASAARAHAEGSVGSGATAAAPPAAPAQEPPLPAVSKAPLGRPTAHTNGAPTASSPGPLQEAASCSSGPLKHHNGDSGTAAPSIHNATEEAGRGPDALAAACMPFEDPGGRGWYCCDLFAAGGGSVPGLQFASTPAGTVRTFGTADETSIALQALQGAQADTHSHAELIWDRTLPRILDGPHSKRTAQPACSTTQWLGRGCVRLSH